MYIPRALASVLFALACADGVAGRAALLGRQDPGSTVSATGTSQVSSDSSSTALTEKSKSTSQTSTAESTTERKKTKAAEQTSTPSTISTSTSTPRPTAQHNGTAADKADKLPIQPTITPALGIAGVVLMLTGAVYCIIGIKHQWFVVFFSAAYLTSLSVAVLIIYVMSPPVSDAIQGAYFVAIILTGMIFGAISIVFKEVTEGLGCLLGGFCLSMWFLVLRPGSLIPGSTTGRAIMIGVFSAVGWSLSFSQYTRNYGLIGCTAFAGATITILGVDCFSRAGLKEFWLYIWDLNSDIFPIHTDTYPITRGIRVEIAGTVVLFLFGVMSQIKVWKIVRERKAKKEAAREDAAERREQRDSAIGKKVEANNGRSLAQWEAVYGDKDKARIPTDSGVGTSLDGDPKKSASVAERELGSIEMDDMGGVVAKHSSKGYRSTVMVRTGSEDETQQESHNPDLQLNLDPEERLWWEDFNSTKTKSNPPASVDESSLNEMLLPDRPPVPGGPSVVALPFSPPADRQDASSEASAASKATAAQDKSVNERRGVALNKLALDKLNQNRPVSLARIDDDRASSVAATMDDDRSIKRKSLAPTIQITKEGLSPFGDEFRQDVPRSPRTPRTPGTPIENPVDEDDDEMMVRSPVEAEESAKEASTQKTAQRRRRTSSTGSHRRSTGSVGAANHHDDAAAQSDNDAASVHSLKGHLPESISKVAMAYRTNEWAKHIADADQPMYEAVPEVELDEAGVQVEVGRPVENPRPLDPAALSETAPPADPVGSSNPSFRQTKSSQELKRPRQSSSPTPVYAFSRTSSHQSLQRQSSSNSISQQRRDTRNASAPITQQPLLESPMEEEQISSGPYQSSSPFISTNNLLDERNTRMSRRTTTTNFNALSGLNFNLQAPTPEPGMTPEPPRTEASSSTDQPNIPGEEHLTLAERKALMEQGAIPPPPSRNRQSSGPLPRVNSTGLIYDSHQPRRTNTVDTVKQNAMLTQWRQSLQQESSARPVAVAEEQARQAMLSQRERAGHRQQKKMQRRDTRESMRDVAMRTGQLASAHQQALSKMQAKANQNAVGKE